ncbi:MAG: 30S ribosomal protein S9 [Candidatus Woesebacteria bacterium]|jgi:small subunit ribosomal protein S9
MAIKLKKKQTRAQKIVKKRRTSSKRAAIQNQPDQAKKNFKIPSVKYIEAIGRRKVATARVRIYEGQGDYLVNDQLVSDYFSSVPNAPLFYNFPFDLSKTRGKFAVTVKVNGSGIRAQLDAVVHGLSRALVKYNPEFRVFLKKGGLLTRDDRMKETRKVGRGGKARRKRQSPKR